MASGIQPVELADAGTDDITISATSAPLFGWSLHESATTAAVSTVLIRRGSVSGPVVAAVELAADGSDSEWFGPQGIHCEGGIYVDRPAGEAGGSIFVG